jgi:hypothetical protein
MAFPSTTTDIIVSAIESRRRKIQDNVTKNNALLTHLREKNRVLPVGGGNLILEELSFAENGNASFYSGYDLLPTSAQDVLSAAQFSLKQAAVPVTISGLEKLQNSGKEEMLDLMDARLDVAEATLANIITQGCYGDGTAWNGKSLVGLDAAVEATATASQTSTYGGISRTNFSFWRSSCTRDRDHQHGGNGAGGGEYRLGRRGARSGSAGLRHHGHELLEGLDGVPPGDPAVQ